MRKLEVVLVSAVLSSGCGGSAPAAAEAPTPASAGAVSPGSNSSSTPGTAPAATPGWTVLAHEEFEGGTLPTASFVPDPVPDDGPFADAGVFFRNMGVVPPAAFRLSAPLGAGGWLTQESYTRRANAPRDDFAAVVPDPAGGPNHVLRITSHEHTDATVLRPSAPLPTRYRVSLRVGFADFGDGKPGLNGYTGGEKAGPWWPNDDATTQNGFYWLAILDAMPRPHNNTWIHHHRKVVVDSDNNVPPWMEMFDGHGFITSGEHPVMMFALDGSQPGSERSGPPFYSWSGGAWQPSGAIRAVDAYLPNTWYDATIERDGASYTIEISGNFRYGGQQTYRATIDAAARCVFHYPADAAEADGARGCVDEGAFDTTPGFPRWPAGTSWPEWFMLGDPHSNYYEGTVYYDDLKLEVPAGS